MRYLKRYVIDKYLIPNTCESWLIYMHSCFNLKDHIAGKLTKWLVFGDNLAIKFIKNLSILIFI